MEEKSVPPPSAAPAASAPSGESSTAKPKHDEAWQPRVDHSERVFHIFKNETLEADSILESPQIRDPEQDTAPLQGTKDRSDEDSLESGE